MRRSDPSPALPERASGCLHLVASADAQVLDACLSHLGSADSVLFLDLGVLHLLRSGSGSLAGAAAAVYFAAADLQAHGLIDAARRSRVEVLDDDGFCALLERHRHCLSWT